MTLLFITFSGVHPTVWAVIITAIGAILLKIVEHHLGKRQQPEVTRRDVNAELNDLNKRVAEQSTRIDELEAEITMWRNRYYEEQEHGELLRMQMIQGGITPPPRRPPV